MKALLLLLIACSRPVDLAEVARALPAVNEALAGAKLVTAKAWTVPVTVAPLAAPADGFTSTDCHVTIASYVSVGANVSEILLHEYGHSLGLGHSSDAENIMFAGPADPIALDVAARQLFTACEHRTCNALNGMRIQ